MRPSNLAPTVAEYFAGIGLIRMGLEPCGWRVVFANDISEQKWFMYKSFFADTSQHYVVKDIFLIDPLSVPSTTLATCSFPCIDLSLAGNMTGIDGKHSSAFWGFIRVLQAQGRHSPPLILVENVPGWLCSNKGADFRVTMQALNDLGYACDVFTLDAWRFTPQSRLRVFLVGVKQPVACRGSGDILKRSRALLSERLKKSILGNVDLRWFYTEIPEPPPLRTGGVGDIVEDLADTDERWWSRDEVRRHLNMMEGSHLDRVKQLMRNGRLAYRTFFRRRRDGAQRAEVRRDDLAGCLRTAVGGSGRQFLIKVSRSGIRMRAMTPREYARLQGVPETYPIGGSGPQTLTAFGDAVCVPAVSWIGKNVLNPLAAKLTPETSAC